MRNFAQCPTLHSHPFASNHRLCSDRMFRQNPPLSSSPSHTYLLASLSTSLSIMESAMEGTPAELNASLTPMLR